MSLFVGIFGALSALSPSLPYLLVLRFLVGIGIGGANIPYSLFSEFLPTARRGAGMLVNQMWWTLGAVTECGVAWQVLSGAGEDVGWRWLLLYSTLPIVALYPLLWWLPESPRYLGQCGVRFGFGFELCCVVWL